MLIFPFYSWFGVMKIEVSFLSFKFVSNIYYYASSDDLFKKNEIFNSL